MTILKLDYDRRDNGPDHPSTYFRKRWNFLADALGWRLSRGRKRGGIRYFRTKHGWHVTVGIKGHVPILIVVAAQACLGSDLKRETFNLARAVKLTRIEPRLTVPVFWMKRVNVLYQRKLGGRRRVKRRGGHHHRRLGGGTGRTGRVVRAGKRRTK